MTHLDAVLQCEAPVLVQGGALQCQGHGEVLLLRWCCCGEMRWLTDAKLHTAAPQTQNKKIT